MSRKVLLNEAYDSFRFLMDHTNFDESSKGYGLTLDQTSNKIMSSICASGFMLTGLVIGAARGWISHSEAKRKAYLSIKNFYENIPHYKGFFVHYANFNDGSRYKQCEYSTIDTALLLNGILTVDAYFQDEEISKYANLIFNRVDFNDFVSEFKGNKVFRMAYNDLKGGDYRNSNDDPYIWQWDMMAEQLCLYFLSAASDKVDEDLALKLYYGFARSVGGYKDYQFVHSPGNALFIYMFSHAWFDFKSYIDERGFDWFNNSKMAILANQAYCKDNPKKFKTFSDYAWGVSACDGPQGYRGYGLPPYGLHEPVNPDFYNSDGTVALYALCGSLPFASKLVEKSVKKLVKMYPELIKEYGFVDAFNLEDGFWVAKDYIGIDKGITLLMIDNHYYQTTWMHYMSHPLIKKAIKKLRFRKKDF